MLVAVAIIYIPGLLLGRAAKLQGWQLVGLAPVLSVFIIAVGAVLAGLLGMRWSVWTLAGLAAFMIAAAIVFDYWRRKILVSKWYSTRHPGQSDVPVEPAPVKPRMPGVVAVAVPVLVGVIIATWQFVSIVGAPNHFADGYDNIFHLSVVRYILNTGNASSFAIGGMNNGGVGGGFYPAAWHGFVSQIALVLGSSNVTSAVNAAIWVIMALVWPIGFVSLIRVVLPKCGLGMNMAAILLSSAMTVYGSFYYDNLFPYWFGLVLVPPILAACVQILGFGAGASPTPVSLLAAVIFVSVVGLALAHPTAVLTLVAFMSPVVIAWAWRGYHRLKLESRQAARRYVWAACIVLLVFACIWAVGHTVVTKDPVNNLWTSLLQVVGVAPLRSQMFWILAVLLIIGFVAMCKRTNWRWWWGPSAVAIFLWIMVSAVPANLFRRILLSGYYEGSTRLSGVLGLAMMVVIMFGFYSLWQWVSQRLEQSPRLNKRWLQWGAAVLAWLVMFVGVQFVGPMQSVIGTVSRQFSITAKSKMVDADEYQVMAQVPSLVPKGVRVAVNPWNGSSLVYALFGVPVTMIDVGAPKTPEQIAIMNYLNTAGTSPDRVCGALKTLDVGYVLDFGDQSFTTNAVPYPGFENLASTPGFVPVASQGHAVLYRIDAC